jgi:hypothetical protein
MVEIASENPSATWGKEIEEIMVIPTSTVRQLPPARKLD